MTEEEPKTEELRSEQAAREAAEKQLVGEAASEDEAQQHERRAQKSAYLKEKLSERAESERDD
jgi:hypothetical protein